MFFSFILVDTQQNFCNIIMFWTINTYTFNVYLQTPKWLIFLLLITELFIASSLITSTLYIIGHLQKNYVASNLARLSAYLNHINTELNLQKYMENPLFHQALICKRENWLILTPCNCHPNKDRTIIKWNLLTS